MQDSKQFNQSSLLKIHKNLINIKMHKIFSFVGWTANGNPTELLYFRWVSLG
ncbi:MAG: hypothetical protein RIS84_1975 [Pseudomonadota bacterium]|jgi:hypothetical protein